MPTLYGIPNCDSVKKARAALESHGRQYIFHDYKKLGVPEDRLDAWLDALGWEALLNRRGTTWRRMTEEARTSVVDRASARELMLALPSIIRRPVVEWPDGAITVGFDAYDWHLRLSST
jgi:Spx/MgsR family transcriptional regulator